MTLIEKTRFILTACDIWYIKEWKEMFDTLSNYIFHLCASYDCNNCDTEALCDCVLYILVSELSNHLQMKCLYSHNEEIKDTKIFATFIIGSTNL